MKKTILLLCGGQSGEHQVSLRSGLSIFASLPSDRYDVIFVGVDHDGTWLTGTPLIESPDDPKEIRLSPHLQPAKWIKNTLNGQVIDCVFSVLHGQFGEDGCMQGALEMARLPYVGSGVLGSAIAMDKDVTKRLALQAGVKTAPYLLLRYSDAHRPTYAEAAKQLGPTLFVKPAAQGSSIGISKVKNESAYLKALEYAFQYDHKVIVEAAIQGREIEIAVLGNNNPIVSQPGEVITSEEFYSYEAKYILGNTQLKIPADLAQVTLNKLKEMALTVFRCIELQGLARIDFFVDQDDEVWLNEPNSLPGFTSISMYSMMFEASGLPYPQLLEKLIELALERYETNQQRQIQL